MASVTRVHALDHVAQVLGEDLEMPEEIVSNDDTLSHGNIITVHTGTDEAITDHGIEEQRDMLRDARRSPRNWHNFLEDVVLEPTVIARVKEKGPR